MMDRRGRISRQAQEAQIQASRAGRFRLLRYFTLASLVAFAIVGLVLFFLQRGEESFFADVQREQAVFLAHAQTDLADKQERSARENLLAVHEGSHVALTRIVANVLWKSDIGPLMARVRELPIDGCRSQPQAGAEGDGVARRQCFVELGQRIAALPGFAELDTKAFVAMHASNVFKIKVFDLRGITIYSSERAQVGEDKADNRGWQLAMSGQPASELTHRDRFSSFEGVVENRDLISSYVPVREADSHKVVGVFEIYSDATAFLDRIKTASGEIAQLAADNQKNLAAQAAENEEKVSTSSDRFLVIVGGLLVLLYAALLLIVRYGQRVIDLQVHAQERATEREDRWHREKMAALATMAANVSHEVGNPLATISMMAQEIQRQRDKNECVTCKPAEILEQTRRIAGMTRHISDFAAAHRENRELVDINQMVKAVLDFLSFDRRFRSIEVEFRAAEDLPALSVIPDYLNEVLMNVLQACTECPAGPTARAGRILVETLARNDSAVIRISCECTQPGVCAEHDPFQDTRFEIVRRRVGGMGGSVAQVGASVEITLPFASSCTAPT
ncbi:MAG TPA: histidine kinase dimerization/phospho-acceptor domain-containing protein [Aromatoleum sp.]|uniref:sensor histidine kinase n=1 Tax=Aromatoleum sp. TaxID=2307007 RepID=UPI002B4886F6|nr:histidine kinase dimerization/phospho-acceptor domain-containing protein [Aromatoleum sp.]HJV25343.1 histidine kinase dimerization/phospho-acceptor domain-containing protein [Aromatoleum sp.]